MGIQERPKSSLPKYLHELLKRLWFVLLKRYLWYINTINEALGTKNGKFMEFTEATGKVKWVEYVDDVVHKEITKQEFDASWGEGF